MASAVEDSYSQRIDKDQREDLIKTADALLSDIFAGIYNETNGPWLDILRDHGLFPKAENFIGAVVKAKADMLPALAEKMGSRSVGQYMDISAMNGFDASQSPGLKKMFKQSLENVGYPDRHATQETNAVKRN